MIKYSGSFASNVLGRQGKLRARFLSRDGALDHVTSGTDPNGKTFYWVELAVESPRRDEIEWVTYRLDPSSYYDPVRVTQNRTDHFGVAVACYGDYVLDIEVQIGPQSYIQRAWLSELLRVGHAEELAYPEIRQALDFIESH